MPRIHIQQPGGSERKLYSVAAVDLTLRQVAQRLAARRAALVAIQSISVRIQSAKTVEEVVRLKMDTLRLQEACLTGELQFLNTLPKIDLKSKQLICFKLFDRDGDGFITLQDLANGLQKMDPTKAYATHVEEALALMEKVDISLDNDVDGMMEFPEFLIFLKDMQVALDCEFDDLMVLLMRWLSFNDTGFDILKETIEEARENAIMDAQDKFENFRKDNPNTNTKLENYLKPVDIEEAIFNARTALIFQMLDMRGVGLVFLVDIIERLVHITPQIMEECAAALLMVNPGQNSRRLGYYDFSTFLLNIAAVADVPFNVIADEMTTSNVRPSEFRLGHLQQFYMSPGFLKEIEKQIPKDLAEEGLSVLQFGRIHLLFHLFDLDGSGYIELPELIEGFQKLKSNKGTMSDTIISQAIMDISRWDEDGDERLDEQEFTTVLCHLCENLRISLDMLIDFLVVDCTLSVEADDPQTQEEYAQKLRSRVLHKCWDVEESDSDSDEEKESSRVGWLYFQGSGRKDH